MDEPESSTGQEQPPAEPTEFDRVMADIEDNDDLDTRKIMEQTGAKEIRPEETAPPPEQKETEEPPKEDEKAPDDKAEDETKEPPPKDSEDRLSKLMKRGRDVGNREYQARSKETELERKAAQLEEREQQLSARIQQADQILEGFKTNPRFLIEMAKAQGVDPKQFGQQLKELITNPQAAQANTEITSLRSEMQEIKQLLVGKREEDAAAQQQRAKAEAWEAARGEIKSYIEQDDAKTAYPLTSRLKGPLLQRYTDEGISFLLQHGIDLSQDSVCEFIEGTLEQLQEVYTGAPAPKTTERSAEPQAGKPDGQRAAPSLSADDKTSGQAGADWDTMSLGDADEDEFLQQIQREVASG